MKRTIFLALMVVTATVAIAEERMLKRSGGGDTLPAYLKLTAEQQTTWDAARTDFEATAGPLFMKLQDLDQRTQAALKNPSADACSIGADIIAQRAIHDQVRVARDAMRQKQQAVLTAEQKLKYEAFHAANSERGEIRMKRME